MSKAFVLVRVVGEYDDRLETPIAVADTQEKLEVYKEADQADRKLRKDLAEAYRSQLAQLLQDHPFTEPEISAWDEDKAAWDDAKMPAIVEWRDKKAAHYNKHATTVREKVFEDFNITDPGRYELSLIGSWYVRQEAEYQTCEVEDLK